MYHRHPNQKRTPSRIRTLSPRSVDNARKRDKCPTRHDLAASSAALRMRASLSVASRVTNATPGSEDPALVEAMGVIALDCVFFVLDVVALEEALAATTATVLDHKE
jgi:hypothetical protein